MSKSNGTASTNESEYNSYDYDKMMFQIVAEKDQSNIEFDDIELDWSKAHRIHYGCPFQTKSGDEIECGIPRHLFEMGIPASRARCPYAKNYWECPIVLQMHGVLNNG